MSRSHRCGVSASDISSMLAPWPWRNGSTRAHNSAANPGSVISMVSALRKSLADLSDDQKLRRPELSAAVTKVSHSLSVKIPSRQNASSPARSSLQLTQACASAHDAHRGDRQNSAASAAVISILSRAFVRPKLGVAGDDCIFGNNWEEGSCKRAVGRGERVEGLSSARVLECCAALERVGLIATSVSSASSTSPKSSELRPQSSNKSSSSILDRVCSPPPN
mmetsp:Transcript_5866/g.12210  ORF Transcript_5866/g.12210 Transcript_5866/m.12210 type:complete len:222 (-) Transcript_5866:6-671(-)